MPLIVLVFSFFFLILQNSSWKSAYEDKSTAWASFKNQNWFLKYFFICIYLSWKAVSEKIVIIITNNLNEVLYVPSPLILVTYEDMLLSLFHKWGNWVTGVLGTHSKSWSLQLLVHWFKLQLRIYFLIHYDVLMQRDGFKSTSWKCTISI